MKSSKLPGKTSIPTKESGVTQWLTHQASTVPKKQGQTSTQNRFDRLSGHKILPLTGNPQLFTGDLPILIAILIAESKMFFQPRSLILEHPKK